MTPQAGATCEHFRGKIYNTLDEPQADPDTWVKEYNEQRVDAGRYCFGRILTKTFEDSLPLVKEKMLSEGLLMENKTSTLKTPPVRLNSGSYT